MDQTVAQLKKLFAVEGLPDGDVKKCETPEALRALCIGHKQLQLFIISHTDFEPVSAKESLACLEALKTKNDMNRVVFCSQALHRKLEASPKYKIAFFGNLMAHCKFYSYPTYLALLTDKGDLAESNYKSDADVYGKLRKAYIEALHHADVVGESVQL